MLRGGGLSSRDVLEPCFGEEIGEQTKRSQFCRPSQGNLLKPVKKYQEFFLVFNVFCCSSNISRRCRSKYKQPQRNVNLEESVISRLLFLVPRRKQLQPTNQPSSTFMEPTEGEIYWQIIESEYIYFQFGRKRRLFRLVLKLDLKEGTFPGSWIQSHVSKKFQSSADWMNRNQDAIKCSNEYFVSS